MHTVREDNVRQICKRLEAPAPNSLPPHSWAGSWEGFYRGVAWHCKRMEAEHPTTRRRMVGELESREGWGRVGSFIAQGDEQQLINKGYFIYHHCCVWCRGAEIAVQAWSFSLSFYSEIWGLNSGCHACIASSLIPWAIPLVLRRFLRRLKVNGGLVSLLLWHTSEIITLEEEKGYFHHAVLHIKAEAHRQVSGMRSEERG